MPIFHILPVPQSPQKGFYAVNNPYQASGPKGFTEFKYTEENRDLYVKLDFPGVTKESLVVRLEPSEKTVIVTGDAPKESPHDSSHRKYGTATGLICDCCVISNIESFVENGVVRLLLSKKKTNLHHTHTFCTYAADGRPLGCRGIDPLDPAFTGPIIVPHPSVLKGSKSAYELKQLPNGGLFLRIDMPGVPKDRFSMVVDGDGVVTVVGRAPAIMHDSCGRNYVGKVALVPRGYDGRRIEINAKHGVVRLIITP
ncbi:hypothetical protein CARUB_v10005559mg [Capsella rubella]|uniref:SHSP domain-containing protein n=1 Tax=Capsella rubella TaxID=81985 RepID=R0F639_9BRAS|nr:hypothetical protein CARUB_v10005559mg [Capsella rubella]